MNPETLSLYGWLAALTTAALLQLVLLRKLPEGRHLLRQHALIAALCVGIAGAGYLLPLAGYKGSSGLCAAIAVMIMGILLIRLVGLSLFRVLLPSTGFIPPRILEDLLLVLAYIGWGMVRLRYAGLDLGSLVTTSAVITGIVAFSMQETLGNILGGLALQLDNSVQIGDWIKVDDVRGRVIEVHWRHTAVQTNNGDVVVIPNSLLMKSKVDVFSSEARPHFRRWVYFPLNYPTPPQQVISAIEKAIRDADIDNVAKTPAPQCVVMDYSDGSTIYALRYWLTDPQHDDSTDSSVRIHIYSALQRQGFQLARPCLETHLTTENKERDARLHAQEIQARIQTLSCVEVFASLNEEELRELAESLRPTPFIRGDVMTRQGAVAHWLYLLVNGEADIWYEAGNADRRHLTTLQAGDVFGEMGLMTGEPRRATVTAKTDALCYRLDKSGFEKILRARPEIAQECARILGEREHQLATVRQEKPVPAQEHEARILAGIKRFFGLTS